MSAESTTKVLRAIDVAERLKSAYPAPYDKVTSGRGKRALGDAVGLSQFGVNLTRLAPGAASALLHWHSAEDEFIYILEGSVILEEDGQEAQVLEQGMIAGFPAGRAVGHRLVNRGDEEAVILEVGSRIDGDKVTYPKTPLKAEKLSGYYRFEMVDKD